MNYKLIRSNRRTLSVEVTRDAEIVVRAPYGCTCKYIESFVSGHDTWIREKLAQRREFLTKHPEPDDNGRRELIEKAKDILPKRTAYYADVMGMSLKSIKITSARTRYGSCSNDGGICYSWRLMMFPPEAIDYVVVHELAHLVHRNHGRGFYKMIESVLPDYRERIKLLKQ